VSKLATLGTGQRSPDERGHLLKGTRPFPLILPDNYSSLSAMSFRTFCFLRIAPLALLIALRHALARSSARLRYCAAVVGVFPFAIREA